MYQALYSSARAGNEAKLNVHPSFNQQLPTPRVKSCLMDVEIERYSKGLIRVIKPFRVYFSGNQTLCLLVIETYLTLNLLPFRFNGLCLLCVLELCRAVEV